MAETTYIEDFDFGEAAVIACGDEIIARLPAAKDRAGRQILQYAGLMTFTEADFNHPTPFALLRIIDGRSDKMTQNYNVASEKAEVIVVLIFSAKGSGDIQRAGFRLRDAVTDYLMDKSAGRPNGWDRGNNRYWGFDDDTNFRARISRGVERLDGSVSQQSGSRFSIPIQFKVTVNPGKFAALHPTL